LSILFALLACSYDPTVGTLPDNVGQAFAPCQESEIKFLATKHNFQTVFEPCGKNSFATFTWSPDGARLYFQLGQTGYVMNAAADDKQTITVPTPSPIGAADWLTANRLVLPVGPADDGGPNRIAVFDVEQQAVFYRDVPHARVAAVHRTADPDSVLVEVASGDDAPRALKRVALADGALSTGPEWITAFDTLDWVVTTGIDVDTAPPAEVVVLGKGETVTLHDATDGRVLSTFAGATRGSLHPGGRWLALERLGDSVSVFYQRAWDDMSERQREREQKRAERLAAGLPDSYPTTVQPPMIDLVDLNDGARWNLTSVHGSHYQWYEAQPYWASFIFWGFEGKQFKRNVLLGQMGNRLRATELGRDFMGVVPANDAARGRSAPEPTEPSGDQGAKQPAR
jgi:hypothetical protein